MRSHVDSDAPLDGKLEKVLQRRHRDARNGVAVVLTPSITVRLPEPAGWLEVSAALRQGSQARMIAYGEGRQLGDWVSGAGVIRYGGRARVDAIRLVSDRYEHGLVPVLSICYRTAAALRDEL